MSTNAPFIKWSGSKRFQAEAIAGFFPRKINTYYECFLGGGSVLRELLERIYTGRISCENIICGDLNADLISVFNVFLNDRKGLFEYYRHMYAELKKLSGFDPVKDKAYTKEHCRNAQPLYYEYRKKYNDMPKDNPERPYIFYWLTRTCFNGLIRYNPKGEFNTPFHVAGRLGITPEKLEKVFAEWGVRVDMMKGRISFVNKSYDDTVQNAGRGDVVYMDPPYENTTGMYFAGGFDTVKMYGAIRRIEKNGAKVLLSYDGFTGDDDRTADVPRDIYKYHTYIMNTRSAFKLLKSNSAGTSKTDDVRDSLYLSFVPETAEPAGLF